MASPVSSTVWTSHAPGNAILAFTDGDTLKRFTIVDAQITPASNPPVCVIRRADIADVDDPGWVYVANVVSIDSGSFDVLVAALAGDALAAANEFPNENVTLIYYLLTT